MLIDPDARIADLTVGESLKGDQVTVTDYTESVFTLVLSGATSNDHHIGLYAYFGSATLVSSGTEDGLLAKYIASDGSLVWARSMGGAPGRRPRRLRSAG